METQVTDMQEQATTSEEISSSEEALRNDIIAALRTVYDPEIPVNIFDLGLIYTLDIAEGGKVSIEMTLTAPACPVAGTLPGEVEARVDQVPGVTEARVELVWEPQWNVDMMTDDVKLQLGML